MKGPNLSLSFGIGLPLGQEAFSIVVLILFFRLSNGLNSRYSSGLENVLRRADVIKPVIWDEVKVIEKWKENGLTGDEDEH